MLAFGRELGQHGEVNDGAALGVAERFPRPGAGAREAGRGPATADFVAAARTGRARRLLRGAALALAWLVWACGCVRTPCPGGGGPQPTVDELVAQVGNRCCDDLTEPTQERPDTSCKRRDGSVSPFRVDGAHSCVRWAAECLGEMGPAATAAVPALLEALESGPNTFDTGDGVIMARDAVMRALGRIGDERAVQPLLDALADPRRRVSAARGMEIMGPAADAAGDTVIELVRQAPDAEGNSVLRGAVASIRGREAATRLPPNFDRRVTLL